jgi:c-di-GMP-binding flagellar brake protein YcgR
MPEQKNNSDKRQFKRIKASFIVVCRVRKPSDIFMFIDDEAMTGVMLDLSEDGIALSTEYNFPLSMSLAMEFTLVNPFTYSEGQVHKIEATGEVRNSLAEAGGYRVGIQFTQISSPDRKVLVDFVKTSGS